MPSPGRTRQGVRRPSAHIPAPAHRPDAAARAPGNIGHGRGNEARVTGRTTGRNDPPARVTGTAAVAGGRSPGMPHERARGTSGPATGGAAPVADSALSATCTARKADCRPPAGAGRPCSPHRPARRPRVSAVAHGHPSTRRDGTGRDGGHRGCRPTGRRGYVLPLPILSTGGMPPLFPSPRPRRTRARPCGAPVEAVHRRPDTATAHATVRRQRLGRSPCRLPLRARGGMPHLRGRELPP